MRSAERNTPRRAESTVTREPLETSIGSVAQPARPAEHLLRRRVRGRYNLLVKPALGFILAALLLLVLWPVLAVVAIAVVLDSGLPVLYRAERGGFKGQPFRIFKFRTMVRNAEALGGGTTAMDDSRITRVGGLLRKTKLDEIPQLLNVLRGEMCFVGPRPELLKYTTNYRGLDHYILDVRPGITDFSSLEFIDLATVVGSGDADAVYEQQVLHRKNALRLEYVAKVSLATDMRIFVLTVVRTIQQALNYIFGGR